MVSPLLFFNNKGRNLLLLRISEGRRGIMKKNRNGSGGRRAIGIPTDI